MSKWVNEHFIYLCIPEFYLLAAYENGNLEVAAMSFDCMKSSSGEQQG
jgi:hypothetical protein